MATKKPETETPAAAESATKAPISAVSAEFARGARAAAESMKAYFQDEDQYAIYNVPNSELDSFEESAVFAALRDEENRIAREKSLAARK